MSLFSFKFHNHFQKHLENNYNISLCYELCQLLDNKNSGQYQKEAVGLSNNKIPGRVLSKFMSDLIK